MSSRMDRHREESEAQHHSQPVPQHVQHRQQPEQMMGKSGMPPKPPKKRKKKHWFRRVFFLLLALILAYVIFAVISFRSGYKEARSETEKFKTTVSEFNGEASTDGSYNVLLLGSDSRGEDQGRSDSTLIAHFSKSGKIKLVSVMRDTYVNIPGYGYNKLNAAYSEGGPDLVRKTLKKTFNISIQYYAIVNFESFPKIVDTLFPKGLKINATFAKGTTEMELDGTTIKSGVQYMNGTEALQYSRFRHDAENDFGRVRRQREVLNAIATQVVSFRSLFTLPKAAGKTLGYVVTDLPQSKYFSIGKALALNGKSGMKTKSIPITGSWSDAYLDSVGSYLNIDEDANTKAIANFFDDK